MNANDLAPAVATEVEKLNEAAGSVRAGDVATLVPVLEACETLARLGEEENLPRLREPAAALAGHVRTMIMDEAEDPKEAVRVLQAAAEALQGGVNNGGLPALGSYPEALGVDASDDAGDAPQPAPPGEGAVGAAPGNGGAEPVPAGTPEPEQAGDEGAFASDPELLAEYLSEQRGRLEEMEGLLLTLERQDDAKALADLRRALHTIKGDSGFLGLSQVAQLAHAAETYLDGASYPYDLEGLFTVKDCLERVIHDLASDGRIEPSAEARMTRIVSLLERGRSPAADGAAAAARGAAGDEAAQQQADGAASADASQGAAGEPPEVPGLEGEVVDLPPGTDPEADGGGSDGSAATEAPGTAPAGSVPLTADESLLVDFISESKEHLDNASAQLLSLESDPGNDEALNSVFRAFHTVKGIAGFLNLEEIQRLAHAAENLLDLVRRAELELTAGLIDLVFEALDWLNRLIGNVSDGLRSGGYVKVEPELEGVIKRILAAQEGEPAQPKSVPEAPAQAQDTAGNQRLGELLVESGAITTAQLEAVVEESRESGGEKKLGELLVEKRLVSPSDVHNALKRQHKPQQGDQERQGVELKETIRVDYDRLENMIDTIGELVLAEAMISQDDDLTGVRSEALERKLHNLRQVSRKLQELGTTIRMVPIAGLFQKMARLVRDLSRKSGKKIAFHTRGDETELDRVYVDQIADPLVHMIRNAVDHGLESPQERAKAGKPEEGSIELRAYHEGGNIHMEIRDDGRGLDRDRILAKALDRGLIDPDEKLNDQEVYALIFEPGFSTAASITEVSGRGVGMDVVRRNISELRGQISITSEPGVGTTFKVVLPLTLALIDGMLVRAGSERFIIPVLSVLESLRPSQEMINTVVGKGEMISLRSRQIPLYRLGQLFNIPDAKDDPTEGLVVVLENESRRIGLMVDDLVGMQQTVIKNVSNGLFQTMGLAGGTVLADGSVGLILDVAGLIQLARGGAALTRAANAAAADAAGSAV